MRLLVVLLITWGRRRRATRNPPSPTAVSAPSRHDRRRLPTVAPFTHRCQRGLSPFGDVFECEKEVLRRRLSKPFVVLSRERSRWCLDAVSPHPSGPYVAASGVPQTAPPCRNGTVEHNKAVVVSFFQNCRVMSWKYLENEWFIAACDKVWVILGKSGVQRLVGVGETECRRQAPGKLGASRSHQRPKDDVHRLRTARCHRTMTPRCGAWKRRSGRVVARRRRAP